MAEESMMPNCTVSVAEPREVIATASNSDNKDKAARRALLVAVAKVSGFPAIPEANKDAVKMRDFLVDFRGYRHEDIVLMIHDERVTTKLYPSRANMLREIDKMVRLTSQHDHLFFYYSGRGDQVSCRHGTEADGKDEAILTYTGKRITDNVLKERLVDPLPQGAKLFALWDCSHSYNILDLEHYECNGFWRAPFKVLSGLGRKTESSDERLSASLLRDSSGVQSSTNDGSQTIFESLTTDNMCLGPRASSPETYLLECTVHCPVTLPENRCKAHVVSLSACRDNELVYDDNATGETVTKFFIAYLECNPNASYSDLLSHIRHRVDGTALGQTQRPSYSSDYPLDMLQIVDL